MAVRTMAWIRVVHGGGDGTSTIANETIRLHQRRWISNSGTSGMMVMWMVTMLSRKVVGMRLSTLGRIRRRRTRSEVIDRSGVHVMVMKVTRMAVGLIVVLLLLLFLMLL